MYTFDTMAVFKLGGGGGGGGVVSRDFDSNPGISDKLSRDWTSLGWQVCKGHSVMSFLTCIQRPPLYVIIILCMQRLHQFFQPEPEDVARGRELIKN